MPPSRPPSPPSRPPSPPLRPPSPSLTLFITDAVTTDPPPPYPAHSRRSRPTRVGRRRRRATVADTPATPSASTGATDTYGDGDPPDDDDDDAEHDAPTESTPLLPVRAHDPNEQHPTRQRTLSLTSTIRSHSSVSIAPSFAHTVLSAFRPERDCDLDPDDASPALSPSSTLSSHPDMHLPVRTHGLHARWRRYWRPLGRRAYYAALLHLLVLNFPFALVAWLYLFVFTLTGTTTLMALPVGAILCFLDLLGARVFARAELALQSTFHGPLVCPPYPPRPIFTRVRTNANADADVEASGRTGPVLERSFYRNTYAMFTDATSYQALFYFLIIKPGITLALLLTLLLIVPLATVLVFPAPAVLRLVRRVGVWQAGVAVEGLWLAVR